jgi:hypothetical protein
VIWLTWRQQRAETIMTGALLAALAVLLILTGRHMAAVYHQLHLAACSNSGLGSSTSCGDAVGVFERRFSSLQTLLGWFNLLPALTGILFAAPVVLELEQGTYRLSWTQSVTRPRWLAAKLAGAIVATLVTTFALTMLITWWRGPLDHLDGRWDSNTAFNFEAIVPYAYALFALALALAVGTVSRRVIVLVGGAFAGFLAVRLPIQMWLRQHYLPPVHRILDPSLKPPDLTNAWVLQESYSAPAVHPSAALYARSHACFSHGPHSLIAGCLHRLGFLDTITFQPADRYWAFQGIEAAIFVSFAAALFALAAWWVRRRIA